MNLTYSTRPIKEAVVQDRNQRNEMDMLASEGTPTRPKSTTKALSRTPRPDMEIGRVVTVTMIGKKTKSAVKDSCWPNPNAIK